MDTNSKAKRSKDKHLCGRMVVLALMLLVATTVEASPIVTSGAPTNSACCFGNEVDGVGRTNVRTVGQTFVVPSNATAIANFSFWLSDFNGDGNGLQYKAYLMDWDSTTNGGIAVGSVLFESNTQSGKSQATATLEKVTFEIAGGQSITAGNDYVIFISTLDFAAGDARNAFGAFEFFPAPAVDAYLDGMGVVFAVGNQDTPFSAITDLANGGSCTNCWNALSPYLDMAFEVQFASAESVPTPGTLVLVGLGLVGMRFRRNPRTQA